ncbi:hypothetical protein EST92_11680 [Streptomyces sp. TM32]|uniref:hypothetical protein n=1 Tax=Streptomyces sp. TM32 TaxID=1652669 RepID=UPI001011B76A|nr:hypothetical protein [Streptomyces sp. TM32]RXS84211.1 hypothetical protein EST92_11680 [Streptomyces sp. TM32]
MAFESSFRTPKTKGECDANIRQAQRHQRILRQRGDYDGAREWDAEIQHQQAHRKRITDQLDADTQKIWGH